MTTEELQARKAHEADKQIRAHIQRMRQAWAELARHFYEWQRVRGWRALGYNTVDEWLAQPEIDLDRRTFFNLSAIWRQLVVERGVDPKLLANQRWSNVQEVLPAIRRGFVDPDEALADARELTRTDLRAKYEGSNGEFRAENEPMWDTCPACGSRYKVRKEGEV